MDAKSKANFINSVASGANIPCPKCGTSNKPDSQFCGSCGEKFEKEQSNSSAIGSSKRNDNPNTDIKTVESKDVFAKGLPDWNIEPPMVLVRRR